MLGGTVATAGQVDFIRRLSEEVIWPIPVLRYVPVATVDFQLFEIFPCSCCFELNVVRLLPAST